MEQYEQLLKDILSGKARFNNINITSKGKINISLTNDVRGVKIDFVDPQPNVELDMLIDFGGELDYVIIGKEIIFIKVTGWPLEIKYPRPKGL